MGEPSPREPWGFQFEGHHLVLNYFVLGDQVVMTPSFYGSEPRVAPPGAPYAGLSVFNQQIAAALKLALLLDPTQRARATISAEKSTDDVVAAAGDDDEQVAYQGLPVRDMSPDQRELLFALVAMFVLEDEGHAAVHMADIRARAEETWFSWVGATSPDAPFYWRVQNPVVLVQFDCQGPGPTGNAMNVEGPTRNHIHSLVRTPNGNDYGQDLLAQHLATAHQR